MNIDINEMNSTCSECEFFKETTGWFGFNKTKTCTKYDNVLSLELFKMCSLRVEKSLIKSTDHDLKSSECAFL